MRNSAGDRYNYDFTFTTGDEIAFVTGLATGRVTRGRTRCATGWSGRGARPAAFAAYAALVMSGMRAYGQAVDVAAVRAAIAELGTVTGRMSGPEGR